MTDREKIIELLNEAHDAFYANFDPTKSYMGSLADCLIANGFRLERKQATSDKVSDKTTFTNVAIETNIYDSEEIHHNCTVQILHNSVTGEQSVGWWKEKEHRWISVEDRLPDEQHDWVLVSIEFVPEGECAVPHVAELRDGVWHAYCDDIPLEEAFLKVTHWMPLPEPPKET